MIYQNIMNKVGRRSALPGLAGELDALKSDLSSLMVSNKVIVHDAVGPPAGSKRISDAEAARGLDTTYGPNVADRLKLLTIGQLVKLTQDAIRVRKSQGTNDTKELPAVPEAFNPTGQATPVPTPTPMPSAPPVPPVPDLATPAPTLPMPTPMPPMPMPTPMPASMPELLAPQASPVQVSEPLINLLSQQSGLAPPL